MTTSMRPTEGCWILSSYHGLPAPRTSTFSIVLDVMVQVRELGTFLHASQIRLNSFSQGQAWFDYEEHLYSGYPSSLVRPTTC
jgi:hypothetical protein